MKTVVTIEVSITDHPDYEVLVECYSDLDRALNAAKEMVLADRAEYGEDEGDLICKQVGENQYKLNYEGSLNDWYVTVQEVK